MKGHAKRSFLDAGLLSRLSRLMVQARYPMLGSISGLHRSATRGSSVEFAEYRKYVPGDDIKFVDWRVFARTDRFYMKEFEADTNLRCTLVLDVSRSMDFAWKHGSKFDLARRMLATLAYLLVQQGDAVGLHCFSDRVVHDIPPRRSPVHLRELFDTLEKLQPRGPTDLVERLHQLAERMKRRSLVVIFSDFFAEPEPLLDAFQHLRFFKHDVALFHLLDRQELAFEFDRPIRFADLESPATLITDPAHIAETYRRELERWLSEFTLGCRKFHLDYQRVLTDQDLEKTLAGFMLARMGAGSATR